MDTSPIDKENILMRKYFFALLTFCLLLSGCAAVTPEKPSETIPENTTATEITTGQTTTQQTEAAESASSPTVIRFTAQDREGNTWTDEIFQEQTLIMLNFWEPWCGPCVKEMPDLNRLYEAYQDKGFLILGIYATEGSEEDVQAVLDNCGITYPILHYSSDFDLLQTGYVPNTVFLNSRGELLTMPFSGALSYEEWAEIVEKLL